MRDLRQACHEDGILGRGILKRELRSPFRFPITSLRTGDAALGGWVKVFFRGACPRKNDLNCFRRFAAKIGVLWNSSEETKTGNDLDEG